MSRMSKNLLLCCAFTLLPLLPGCKPEGIIPPEGMEMLFADFYRADATIEVLHESALPVDLDSMRVYLPIVEAHGYTKDEFRASLEHYLHHPDQMVKIFDRVKADLEREADRPPVIDTEEAAVGHLPEDNLQEDHLQADSLPRDKQPQRQKKSRRKLSKDALKQLEEGLK